MTRPGPDAGLGGTGGPLDRPYVVLPAEGRPAGPPLLLLHGTGGDEHDLLPLRGHLSPGAAVLSPRGTVLENGMPRFFRRLAEGVFDEADLSARADELAAFVRAAGEQHGISPSTLVAVGFSNGTNIASALLLGHPGLLTGAVLVAAMVPYADPPPADLTGTTVVVSNGRRDPMIDQARTALLVHQLRERHADVHELAHPGGHSLDAGVVAEVARLLPRLADRG